MIPNVRCVCRSSNDDFCLRVFSVGNSAGSVERSGAAQGEEYDGTRGVPTLQHRWRRAPHRTSSKTSTDQSNIRVDFLDQSKVLLTHLCCRNVCFSTFIREGIPLMAWRMPAGDTKSGPRTRQHTNAHTFVLRRVLSKSSLSTLQQTENPSASGRKCEFAARVCPAAPIESLFGPEHFDGTVTGFEKTKQKQLVHNIEAIHPRHLPRSRKRKSRHWSRGWLKLRHGMGSSIE